MSARRKAWTVGVKYGGAYEVIAVFRTKKRAERWRETGFPLEATQLAATTWKAGVEAVRLLIFRRDGYKCVRCGKDVTRVSGQMDEKKDRGKGGEVSIFNSRTLCGRCHIGPRGKHRRRAPRFSGTRI